MWMLTLTLLLSFSPQASGDLIEKAYLARGTSVRVDRSMLHAPSAVFPSARVLEIRWDAIRRESLVKIAGPRSVTLITTAQELPPLRPAHGVLATSRQRIRAGSFCRIVAKSGSMALSVEGMALRTAPVGSETRVRVPALKDRILTGRVLDTQTVAVLP